MNKLDIRNLRLADFGYNLNKTRQTLSDVILQEGDGVLAQRANPCGVGPSQLNANFATPSIFNALQYTTTLWINSTEIITLSSSV